MAAPAWPFRAFVASLAFFHLSEFLAAARFTPAMLSRASFLVSRDYAVAMAAATLEYGLEATLAPAAKGSPAARVAARVGLVMVVLGEGLRKAAWITARHNFTHEIQTAKRREHVLVTAGVYRYVRHPGYLGWLVWAVGTQVLLGNPVCAAAFAAVAWRFFVLRIPAEEAHLRQFFGPAWQAYAVATPTRIPFIP